MTPLDFSIANGLTFSVLFCGCVGLLLRLRAAWRMEKYLRDDASVYLEQRNEALDRVSHLETELSTAGGDLQRQENEIVELRARVRTLSGEYLSAQTPEALGEVLTAAHGPMSRLVIHLDVANTSVPNDREIAKYLNDRGCSIAVLKSRDPGKLADLFIRTPTDWKRTTQTGTFELIAHGPCFSIGGLSGNQQTGPITSDNPEPIEPGHIRRRML